MEVVGESISEMVGFLQEKNPTLLESLRIQFPGAQEVLRVGEGLGLSEDLDNDIWNAKVETSLSVLHELQSVIKPEIEKRRSKLKAARKTIFIAQAFTIIGGCSVFATKMADAIEWVQYLTATVTLLSSLLALLAQYQSGDVMPGGTGALGEYWKLVGYLSDTERLIPQLEVIRKHGVVSLEGKSLIENAETICADLRKILYAPS